MILIDLMTVYFNDADFCGNACDLVTFEISYDNAIKYYYYFLVLPFI